ncbi:hypothetical protein NJ7G_2604 [Natrinema sp. J7-2]|nr:hypothetical protein NJ7G_2604 [Natrinema sp. J7-2]
MVVGVFCYETRVTTFSVRIRTISRIDRKERPVLIKAPNGRSIVATESHCTPDRTTALRSVCHSFQLLL